MSYYKKLLTTNILISTAYILFFSLIISVFSFIFEKKVYENNMLDYINHMTVEINSSVSSAKSIAGMISSSEKVSDYADEDAPDYFNRNEVANMFHEEITILLKSGARAAITKYYDNHIIISGHSSTFDFFAESFGISKDAFEQAIDDINASTLYSTAYLFTNTANTSYMSIIVRNLSLSGKPYYVVIIYPTNILFNMGQYKDILVPAVSIGDELVYVGDNSLYDSVSDYIVNKKTHGYHIFSFDSKKTGTVQDLTYHFLVRRRLYLYKFIPNILLAFLLFIPLFIIGIFLMRKITNNIYKPVNNLMNALPNINDASENEFDSIISEFYRLESSNTANNRIINQFKISAKDKFISDLLFGTLSTRDIMRYSDEYHLPPITSEATVIIIEYNDYDNLIRTLSRRGLFSLKTTVTSLLRSVFEDSQPLIITETSPNNHVIIAECDDLNNLRVSLQATLLQIMEDMDIDIYASIGQPVDTYINLCDSYYSAIEVSRHQVLDFEHKVVATFLDFNNDGENRIMYLPQTEASLIAAVSSCNFEQVHSLLQAIFRDSHVNSTDGFAQLVIMLHSTIQKILYNLNLPEKAVFGEDTSIYLDLRSCQSISSLKSTFMAQLNTLMNFVSEKYNSKIAERSDEMKNYIEAHYTEDISLLNLAEFMNMSQEHTSRIFKQETGSNFKEYLMHLRYEKAMEILSRDPNAKLKDVAISVGCINAKNLSRLISRYKK